MGTVCHGMPSDAVLHPLLCQVMEDAEGGINHLVFTGDAALPTPSQESAGI